MLDGSFCAHLKSSIMPKITSTDFDCALIPGGQKQLTKPEVFFQITPRLLMASSEIFMNIGNSSSAVHLVMMDQFKIVDEGRKNIIACAFGLGIDQ